MKKKLAILFASLSLCACGFIACENNEEDDNTDEKLAIGAECEKNDACESGFCQKDGDKSVCAAKIANDAACKNADDICADKDYKCKAGEGSDSELKCRASSSEQKAGKGQACSDSIKCDGNNLICDGICKLKANETCEANDVCVAGYECKAGEGSDTDLKCRTIGGTVITDKAGKGDLCGTSANAKQCDEGLVCRKRGGSEANANDKICKIKAGGDCSATGDDVYCLDGTSCEESGGNKTCAKPAELNADCVASTGCNGDFYCNITTNTCQPKLDNGEICFEDNNFNDSASWRNDRCASGHCEGKRVAGSEIPNDFEWKCADKIADGEACTRLLTDEGASFIYTSLCADDDRICRPETYFEGIHGYGFDWVEGKCLPYLLKINKPCTTPHEDITEETECDWSWEYHLICHDTGSGNLCKVADGGRCSKDESCASGHCEMTGSASSGTCQAASK